jgi:hypothetical protein
MTDVTPTAEATAPVTGCWNTSCAYTTPYASRRPGWHDVGSVRESDSDNSVAKAAGTVAPGHRNISAGAHSSVSCSLSPPPDRVRASADTDFAPARPAHAGRWEEVLDPVLAACGFATAQVQSRTGRRSSIYGDLEYHPSDSRASAGLRNLSESGSCECVE